jgi:putative FmdB family regulatory protein
MCTDCKHEWEDEYSIKQEPPTECPECHHQTAKRLVSGGSGRGTVELYGQELVDKCRADAQKMKSEAAKDANKYANLLGEAKYHELQTRMDRRNK